MRGTSLGWQFLKRRQPQCLSIFSAGYVGHSPVVKKHKDTSVRWNQNDLVSPPNSTRLFLHGGVPTEKRGNTSKWNNGSVTFPPVDSEILSGVFLDWLHFRLSGELALKISVVYLEEIPPPIFFLQLPFIWNRGTKTDVWTSKYRLWNVKCKPPLMKVSSFHLVKSVYSVRHLEAARKVKRRRLTPARICREN